MLAAEIVSNLRLGHGEVSLPVEKGSARLSQRNWQNWRTNQSQETGPVAGEGDGRHPGSQESRDEGRKNGVGQETDSIVKKKTKATTTAVSCDRTPWLWRIPYCVTLGANL